MLFAICLNLDQSKILSSGNEFKKNIVEIDEIAHFEQFYFFPPCFPKALFIHVLNEYILRKGLKHMLIQK